MGKSRMMGAGNACSTSYNTNINLQTGGGNKKQGITSRVGLNNWENREVQIQSNGIGRFKLHYMNQLGGVGTGHSMFGGQWNRADGVHYKPDSNNPYSYLLDNSLPDLITLTQFTQIVTVYGNKKSAPIIQSHIEPLFNFLLPYFGIGNKLSKKKIASYDILKSKGIYPRVGSSQGCYGDCPKDLSGYGKACACSSSFWGTWCKGRCGTNGCNKEPIESPCF